ncbi:MAG: HisA/HisF-related TIM barrel protein [Eubacteriales bacterium]
MNHHLNKKFKVIPVLDMKDGIVVQGIKGEREKYQPIKSVLTDSVEILDVLVAFYKKLELTEFYLADLDAIMSSGQKNQLALIPLKDKSRFQFFSFMVDAGVSDVESVTKVFKSGVDKVVIGTETLFSLKMLKDIVKTWGTDKLIISIDTKDAQVLSLSPEISQLTPDEAIRKIRETGIQHFILLDLARVGTSSGLDKKLILKCLEACKANSASSSTLIFGGGVSGYEDLSWLAAKGVEGALVASILHNGKLNLELLKILQSLEKHNILEV